MVITKYDDMYHIIAQKGCINLHWADEKLDYIGRKKSWRSNS
jgi:hypothetical protein